MSASQSQPFAAAQVLPQHLKEVKGWDKGYVGPLLGLSLLVAMHLRLTQGLSWKDVWEYTELPPFYREGPGALHRLNVGSQGHLFFGPRKANVLGGREAVN